MEYGKESEESGWKRQHTVSLPRKLYATLKEEAEARGLTVGELNRSIIRCWAEEKEAPPRFAKAAQVAIKPIEFNVRADQKGLMEVKPAAVMTPAEIRERFPPLDVTSKPAPVVAPPTRLPDPDFDSPESLQEAQRLLASRHNNEDVPF